jgi:amino acid transporter
MSFTTFLETIKLKKLFTFSDSKEFGAFSGVFLPGCLSIFGAITYLRFGSILGMSGLPAFFLILFVGILINFTTALSLSATATNISMKSGGLYFLVSRCFGPEFGMAVGLPLYLTLTVNISFCMIGLMEVIRPFFDPMVVKLIGVLVLVVLMIISETSAKVIFIAQLVVFSLISVSLFYLFKSHPHFEPITAGSIHSKPFWLLFAAFYPAITGIESSLFMAEKLKSPRKSLPLGSLAIVLFTLLIYGAMAICMNIKCSSHDLIHQEAIVMKMAEPKEIMLIALIGSTLIYALGCFYSAPKLLQAMAKDQLLPKWIWEKLQGPKESLVAKMATFGFSLTFLLFFDLDLLSPLLTLFFLLSYAILNLACFIESFIQNPSWRPKFEVKWGYPLVGFLLSIFAMFMIDSGMAFLSLLFVILIYGVIRLKNLTQNFEDIRGGILLYLIRFASYRLARSKSESTKSWRPQIICFSQTTTTLTPLIKISHALTEGKGFLIIASVIRKDQGENKIEQYKKVVQDFLHRQGVQALVELFLSKSVDEVVMHTLNHYGVGPIRPNTILFGYDLAKGSQFSFSNWIEEANRAGKNALILCYQEKRDIERIQQFFFLKKHQPKRIEIWIDDETKEHQELMFLLATMLQRSAFLNKARVKVTAFTPHEHAIDHLKEYYQTFFDANRLNFFVDVKLISEQMAASTADLVMIGIKNNEKDLVQNLKIAAERPMTLLVSHAEKLDFDTLFD